MDEKPQIQALNRTAPTLPMLATTPRRATHDYERHGTCDLFAALSMATGSVITDIRSAHASADFIAFLNKVNRNVPAGLDVHVILDNLSNPQDAGGPPLAAAPPPVPFPLHPHLRVLDEHGRALVLGLDDQEAAQRSAHRSAKELAADIEAWVTTWNENPVPFVWHKTAEQILERLAEHCAAINEATGA